MVTEFVQETAPDESRSDSEEETESGSGSESISSPGRREAF